MKHPLSKHIQFCYQMPSADDIFKYLECLFHAAELGVECAIISLVSGVGLKRENTIIMTKANIPNFILDIY